MRAHSASISRRRSAGLTTSASAPKPINHRLTPPKSATLRRRTTLPFGLVSIFWLGCHVRSPTEGACCFENLISTSCAFPPIMTNADREKVSKSKAEGSNRRFVRETKLIRSTANTRKSSLRWSCATRYQSLQLAVEMKCIFDSDLLPKRVYGFQTRYRKQTNFLVSIWKRRLL